MHVLTALGGERYAVPLDRVLEIHEPAAVSPVPGAPAAMRGLHNRRGEVLPVVDLGVALGVAAADALAPLVVIDTPVARAMLAVDEVLGLTGGCAGAEPTGTAPVVATVMIDGALVGVLDVDAVLDALKASP